MLRKPSKLLGVGFKGDHGTSIGQAKFHNLKKEVELVRDCKLVEVFVKQPLNDQGPPKYCVVPPEKAAEFEAATLPVLAEIEAKEKVDITVRALIPLKLIQE